MSDMKLAFKRGQEKGQRLDRGRAVFNGCIGLVVRNLLHTDVAVRQRSTDILLLMRRLEFEKLLIQAYRVDRVAPFLAAAMGKIASEKSVEALTESLKEEDPVVRAQAAVALGKINNEKSFQVLFELLGFYLKKQSSADVSLGQDLIAITVGGLARLNRRESLPLFLAILRQERGNRIRSSLVSACTGYAPMEIRELATLALKDEDARVQANAIELFQGSTDNLETTLSPFLQSPNNRVRANSALVLFRANPAKIVAFLSNIGRSPVALERMSAFFAMGETRSPEFSSLLQGFLGRDPDANVRRHAALSLGKIGAVPRPEGVIELLLKETSDVVLPDLGRLLIKVSPKEGVPALIELLRESSEPSRKGLILEVLEGHFPEDGLDLLLDCLQSPDPKMARRALAILDNMSLWRQSPELVERVKFFLAGSDPECQMVAAKLLWKWGYFEILDLVRDDLQAKETSRALAASHVIHEILGFLKLPVKEVSEKLFESELRELTDYFGRILNEFVPTAGALTAEIEELENLIRGEGFQQAEKPLHEFIRKNPQEPRGYHLLSQLFRRRGDIAGAIRGCLMAIKFDPRQPAYFLQAAQLYHRNREYRSATGFLRRAIPHYPTLLPPKILLVDCLDELGEGEEMQRIISEILTVEPANLAIRKILTRMFIDRGEVNKGQDEIRMLRVAYPDDPELPLLQLQIDFLGDKREEAFCRLMKIIRNDLDIFGGPLRTPGLRKLISPRFLRGVG